MTIYREIEAGRAIYWTYADGARVHVRATWAVREVARGARLVNVR